METIDKLDLLLINPSLNWKLDKEKKIKMRVENDIPNQETPHIGIAYLIAMAKKSNLAVKYIDMVMDGYSLEDLMHYVKNTNPKVIGFTAFTIQIKSAGILADQIKNKFPGIKICVGGPHVSAIPKRTLNEFNSFDFVVCGEGDMLLKMVYDMRNNEDGLNKIKGIVTRSGGDPYWEPIKDLDSLPFPDWDAFNLKNYPGTYPHRTNMELPIIAGRGCSYRCIFCCRSMGDKFRWRSVDSVIGEIERNIEKYGCESIAFLDETFLADKKWANKFFDLMMSLGLNKKITWSCSTRVTDVSPLLLKRMKETGCYYTFYGFESADDNTLKRIKKGITTERIISAVKWTKEAGIVPVGAFIIGLPGDTKERAYKAIDMAEELDLYSVTFPIAVPFPGTELRGMAEKEEYGMRILSDNWDNYGKQDIGVLESSDFLWEDRKEMQEIAYSRNPKKKMDCYIKQMRGVNV